MANEISLAIRCSVVNPAASTSQFSLQALFDSGTLGITQTTAAVFQDTVTVGTSEQDIALPTNSKFTDVLQGMFCAVNLDTTNFVKLGPKSGTMVEMVRLYPRIPVVIMIAPSVVLRWIADTASCSVQFVWFAK